MLVRVSSKTVRRMRLINEDRYSYSDVRRYYLLRTKHGDALIVLRSGLGLQDISGRVVDVATGNDTAAPGFCADSDIGEQRPKVTIFRHINHRGLRRPPELGAYLDRSDWWRKLGRV